MQTSRFQLGLIATLAVGLGFSLSSSEAVGYPVGAAVSMGANPLWSNWGEVSRGGTYSDVLTVPDGQVAVITGFSSNGDSAMDLYQGDILVMEGNSDAMNGQSSLFGDGKGGLVVEGGTVLRVRNTKGCCGTNYYYIQGYFIQQ